MIFGQEQTLTIGGKSYRLSRFELPLWQEFATWSKTVLPNHYEAIRPIIDKLPEALAREELEKAERKMARRGSINDPDLQELINTPEGSSKIMAMLFRKHHPELSETDVIELMNQYATENPDKLKAAEEALAKANGTFQPDRPRNRSKVSVSRQRGITQSTNPTV